jgi:hypothetical protein
LFGERIIFVATADTRCTKAVDKRKKGESAMAHIQIGQDMINQRGFLPDEQHGQKSGKSVQPETDRPSEAQTKRKQDGIQSTSRETRGFEIAGFPWQFVLIMSVIALGVVAFVAKLATGF